jgi:protein gp37
VLDAPLKRFGAGTKRIDAPYPFGFAPTFHRYRLEAMRKNLRGWKEPRTIFWGSMCDMFGDWVPDSWIEAVFEVCESAPQHRYLFLTKNWLKACNFHFEDNWWVGRTITHKEKPGNDDKNLYLCCGIPKKTEPPWIDHPNIFLSCEPLHGPISDIPYYAHSYGYKWVILGAETGNRKGKIVPQREWIEQIVHDCDIREVPVFMKDSLVGIVGEENMRRELPWEM